MAKIKINKLPAGFKLVNGKIVEDKFMREGGDLRTGDQADYGLVSTPENYYKNTNFNDTNDASVRYSLSSVPRDNANIEAEGGETVLTDLTNDGTFGLYNITGPRHSKGGVPMFLPEQSFIYSDTDKMKFTKDELEEFGISTKNKMTPAELSKKYQLNNHYANLQSPYADKIQATTAELMLKKNMMNLSKIAFGQESKKKFEDGVPLAAHPYLVQQGIDPIEFTAKMEKITKQQAQMKAIAALPPEQQEKLIMLQQMMAQMEEQQSQQEQSFENPSMQDPNMQGQQPMQQNMEQEIMMQEQPMARYGTEMLQKAQKGKEPKPNVAFDQSRQDRYTNDWGITFNDDGVGSTTYSDLQGYQGDGYFGGALENIEGWKEANADYPGMEALLKSLPEYGKNKNPEVVKYQKWFNEVSIPKQVAAMKAERERVGKKFTDEDVANATKALIEDYGFKTGTGTEYDGLMGTWTSSRRPFTYKLEETPEKTVEEKITEDAKDPIKTIIPENYTLPDPEFWLQDQNNLIALGQVDDNLYLPWAPDAQRVAVAPTFDDWRAQVNANNASANTMAQALGAVGGPQAVANSNILGQTMAANAQAINRVNSNNVNIANQAGSMQAQYDMAIDGENARRQTGVYDNTQKVLQAADNFRNWRVGQNAALQNAALTNRANTYNLNSTFDNFAIDPTTGGPIGFTNARALQKTGQPQDAEALKQSYYKDISDLSRELGRSPTEAEIKSFYTYTKPQAFNSDMTRGQQELAEKQASLGYITGAKGKEIKRMVVPFYTGKMGG
jgi:hypothetical protein